MLCIAQRDQTIKQLGQGLINNKGLMRFTIWLIHLFEWKKASRIIKALHEENKKMIVVQ